MSNPSKAADSAELQSLFDSIVGSQKQAAQPITTPAPHEESSNVATNAMAPAAVNPQATPAQPAPEADTARSMFSNIGQLTRKLHDALSGMGYDKSLERAAEAIPDARDRLGYVATLTEKAANRTLNAIDIAQPLLDKTQNDADKLKADWDKLFANQLSIEEFKNLAQRTHSHLAATSASVQAANQQLLEITMAQDFQDLTGQVIKKVVEMAKEMEAHLLEFLLEYNPVLAGNDLVSHNKALPENNADSLLNGPVYNAEGRTDVVTNQEQVDDLLASLGF